MKLTPLASQPAPGALGRTGELSRELLLAHVEVENLSVAPVSGYEPGTGAGLANVPFYGPGSLGPAARAITGSQESRGRRSGRRAGWRAAQ